MDFQRLFDILSYQEAKYPADIALARKEGIEWKTFSTTQAIAQVNRVSAGCLQLGLVRDDKVAIMTHRGSPEWNFLDLGLQQVGVIVVPIHATISEKELIYILNDATIKYCVVQNRELYEKVQQVQPSVLSLKQIYTIELLPDVAHWTELSQEPTARNLLDIQALKAAIHEDDLATIVYTSGTTGEPKGVMLSHKNIVSNIKATMALVPINCDKITISFLPLSHIFERMVTYFYMATGASLYYIQKLETLLNDLKQIRPHYFTVVPRLVERAYDTILESATKLPSLQKKLLLWSIKVGKQYPERKLSFGYWCKLQLATVLVFNRWRNMVGWRVEGIIVGAAALSPELGRLFTAAGFNLREGYGLTETSPVVAFNRFEPGGYRFGTVGIVVPGVAIKIDGQEEGEILVKGPNVMIGYYNKTNETNAIISPEGWLKTGDVGKMVHQHFLQITDRKKDIFKTSSGKYVAPQPIESLLKTSPYIAQAMVVGFQRPYITTLIIPNFILLQQWCEENKVHWTAPPFMIINPRVEKLYSSLLDTFNEALQKHEQIQNFHLLHEEWTAENGSCTPTLKLRREHIEAKFKREIETMY